VEAWLVLGLSISGFWVDVAFHRGFVELCGAVMRSHDSSRQWTFELVEEYGECEE